MTSLVIHAVLGVATTTMVIYCNRHLFSRRWPGSGTTPLEVVIYVFGVASVCFGWYFNVRYTRQFGHRAGWVHFTKSLFTNWASDSAAQDYIIMNVLLFPIWTIVDGRRRGIRVPWGFFVMSLFTSLCWPVALYLVCVERKIRYDRAATAAGGPPAAAPPASIPSASSTA
jgi:hypothetical protein